MRKLSEIKNEEALDVLADLLEPAMEIIGDAEIKTLARAGKKMEAIRHAIKGHKSAVITILARLDSTPVEEYQCNVITLPAQLLEILNDKELMDFFGLQGGMTQA